MKWTSPHKRIPSMRRKLQTGQGVKWCAVCVIACMLMSYMGAFLPAQAEGFRFVEMPNVLRPGKFYEITFDSLLDTQASMFLERDGSAPMELFSEYPVVQGENTIRWDGRDIRYGVMAEGECTLRITLEDGSSIDAPIRIGSPYPMITDIRQSDHAVLDAPVTITYTASIAGTITISLMPVGGKPTVLMSHAVEAGENMLDFSGDVDGARQPDGSYVLVLSLSAANGMRSIDEYIYIDIGDLSEPEMPETPVATGADIAADTAATQASDSIDTPEEGMTPAEGAPSTDSTTSTDGATAPDSATAPDGTTPTDGTTQTDNTAQTDGTAPTDGTTSTDGTAAATDGTIPAAGGISPPYSDANDGTYWSMTPGEEDDAAIWDILMQPITVYDNGKIDSTEHAYLMENPDGSGKKIAQIHGTSQGLHVIGETNEHGYVLVEAFSNYDRDYYPTSEEDIATVFDIKQGYVRASALKTVQPMSDMALLIDKKTQRMYLFVDGVRTTELLISTGTFEGDDYLFETPPGEFITVSHTGTLKDGYMESSMAIRFNGGVLFHEVPHQINKDGTKNYSKYEPYLGTKQSHGCVRVQRKKNDDGYNQKWFWDKFKRGQPYKIIIWDDRGRVDSPGTWYPNP